MEKLHWGSRLTDMEFEVSSFILLQGFQVFQGEIDPDSQFYCMPGSGKLIVTMVTPLFNLFNPITYPVIGQRKINSDIMPSTYVDLSGTCSHTSTPAPLSATLLKAKQERPLLPTSTEWQGRCVVYPWDNTSGLTIPQHACQHTGHAMCGRYIHGTYQGEMHWSCHSDAPLLCCIQSLPKRRSLLPPRSGLQWGGVCMADHQAVNSL